MFTLFDKILAGVLAVGLIAATVAAQDTPPLPRPPLQPMPPRNFNVPKPRLALPELIPVAQQDDPRPATNPVPRSPVQTQPESPVLPPKATAPTGVTLAPRPTGDTRLTGKILRVEKDHIIVESTDHKAIILHVDPQSRILRHDVAAAFSDLAPGTSITAVYTPRGDRYWVTTLDIAQVAPAALAPGVTVVVPKTVVVPVAPPAPTPVAPTPVAEPPVVVPANPPVAVVVPAPAYETEIVRVVAPDQIVVRNQVGNEFTLYVTTATRYMVGDATAGFADFRPGMRIRVADEVRADRHFARQILGVRRP